MAATGNEVARLEQLKGIYPQVVSIGRGSTDITLGNGRTVSFSCANGGGYNTHLLVRVMYNSFELLQAVADSINLLIRVVSDSSMKPFETKMLSGQGVGTGGEGKIYIIANNSLDALDISTENSFNFRISGNSIAFVAATIYVD